MMTHPQHLSDEAVAAFADGVLTGHARSRAARHTQACPECAEAVRVQREAVLVLRTAPAPQLPGGLFDRLCGLPQVTPIASPPTVVMPDGSTMLSTSGALGSVAAFVPEQPTPRGHSRLGAFGTTAAVVALAGALAAGASVAGDDEPPAERPGPVITVQHRTVPSPVPTTFTDLDVFRAGGR